MCFTAVQAEIIGDPDSPATGYTASEAAKYFSVGPPMMVHITDLIKLAPLWSKLMRPVVKQASCGWPLRPTPTTPRFIGPP